MSGSERGELTLLFLTCGAFVFGARGCNEIADAVVAVDQHFEEDYMDGYSGLEKASIDRYTLYLRKNNIKLVVSVEGVEPGEKYGVSEGPNGESTIYIDPSLNTDDRFVAFKEALEFVKAAKFPGVSAKTPNALELKL